MTIVTRNGEPVRYKILTLEQIGRRLTTAGPLSDFSRHDWHFPHACLILFNNRRVQLGNRPFSLFIPFKL